MSEILSGARCSEQKAKVKKRAGGAVQQGGDPCHDGT